MKEILKITAFTVLLGGLLLFWYKADQEDYFKGHYRDMTDKDDIFHPEGLIWRQDTGKIDIEDMYRQHFSDTSFAFPRQAVKTIKLFRNIPMLGVFTARKLRPENNPI